MQVTTTNGSGKWIFRILAIIIALALISAGVAVYLTLTKDTNPIPKPLRTQIEFSPLVPPKDGAYKSEKYAYEQAEDKTKFLSYVIKIPSGSEITISEYPQSPQFTEITGYKDQFLTNVAQQYDTVPSSSGTIYLGRLPKRQNKQVGIMLERGLIVFMLPNKELNNQQWRQLGDELIVQKLNK